MSVVPEQQERALRRPASDERGTPRRADHVKPGFLIVAAVAFAGAVAVPGSVLPIVALLALGLGAIAFARPDWATLLFLFALYLSLPVVATRFHGVPPAAASSTVLILAVPLASYLVLHRRPLVITPALPLMLLYLAALLAATLLSARPESSLPPIGAFVSEGLRLYSVMVSVGVAVLNVGPDIALIPRHGALGAALATAITLVVHNLLKQAGLRHGTGISLFDWQYLRVYLAIVTSALALLGVQIWYDPQLIVGICLVSVASLAVFRVGRSQLEISDTFPEVAGSLLLGKLLSGDRAPAKADRRE